MPATPHDKLKAAQWNSHVRNFTYNYQPSSEGPPSAMSVEDSPGSNRSDLAAGSDNEPLLNTGFQRCLLQKLGLP